MINEQTWEQLRIREQIVRQIVMHIEERVRDSMALAEEQDWLSSEDQVGSVSEAVRNQAGEDYDV